MEIVEQVFAEIKAYGHEDPRKKLIAGIVLTGGGSQLKHIKQLVEYITGMDTRIGYPNDHLAVSSDEEISSPLYATAVGLVINSIRNNTRSATPLGEVAMQQEPVRKQPIMAEYEVKQEAPSYEMEEVAVEKEKVNDDSTEKKVRRSFFDKYIDRIKEFLDNAE